MSAPALRGVQPSDWTALNDLHHWAWFPERSERGWAWLHGFGDRSPGWVLEDEEGVCGYLGNIRQTYAQADQQLQCATGYSLIVLPRAKGGSRALLDAFRNQPDIMAATILNGNARSAPIYAREGFAPFPADCANAKIVWPLAPVTILLERLARERFRTRRPTREMFSKPMRSAALSHPEAFMALDPWVDAASLNRFFADLCRPDALIADRSAEGLQRRFSDPDRSTPPLLFGWKHDGALSATALAQMGKMTECEAPILDLIDVSWTGPFGQRAATELLSQLKALGRALGASRLRLSLVNDHTAAVALAVPGGIVRRRHVHAHALILGLNDHGQIWNPTPYDGDYAFCLRHPPADRKGLQVIAP